MRGNSQLAGSTTVYYSELRIDDEPPNSAPTAWNPNATWVGCLVANLPPDRKAGYETLEQLSAVLTNRVALVRYLYILDIGFQFYHTSGWFGYRLAIEVCHRRWVAS
jgi:hypothetical protein